MLSGERPWSTLSNVVQIIYESGVLKRRPPLPRAASKRLRSLIGRCWAHDPAARPTFVAVLNDLQVSCLPALQGRLLPG